MLTGFSFLHQPSTDIRASLLTEDIFEELDEMTDVRVRVRGAPLFSISGVHNGCLDF